MARPLKGARQTEIVFFLPLEERDDDRLLQGFVGDSRRLDEALEGICEISSMTRTADGFASFIVLADFTDEQFAAELEKLRLRGNIKVGVQQHDEKESA